MEICVITKSNFNHSLICYLFHIGIITANGGNGYPSGSNYIGGGGSGGVITISYEEGSLLGSFDSCGGLGYQSGGPGMVHFVTQAYGSFHHSVSQVRLLFLVDLPCICILKPMDSFGI